MRQIFPNQGGVEVELGRQHLGRHGPHTVGFELVQEPQVEREAVRGLLRNLIRHTRVVTIGTSRVGEKSPQTLREVYVKLFL